MKNKEEKFDHLKHDHSILNEHLNKKKKEIDLNLPNINIQIDEDDTRIDTTIITKEF